MATPSGGQPPGRSVWARLVDFLPPVLLVVCVAVAWQTDAPKGITDWKFLGGESLFIKATWAGLLYAMLYAVFVSFNIIKAEVGGPGGFSLKIGSTDKSEPVTVPYTTSELKGELRNVGENLQKLTTNFGGTLRDVEDALATLKSHTDSLTSLEDNLKSNEDRLKSLEDVLRLHEDRLKSLEELAQPQGRPSPSSMAPEGGSTNV
jgi:hypothetical protein